jgi:hypothetical protein
VDIIFGLADEALGNRISGEILGADVLDLELGCESTSRTRQALLASLGLDLLAIAIEQVLCVSV